MIRRLLWNARFLILTVLIVLVVVAFDRVIEELAPWAGRWNSGPSLAGRIAVPATAIHVADGDTFHVQQRDGSRETIRLLGIDAPELGRRDDPLARPQPYAVESRDFLAQQIRQGRIIEIAPATQRDRFGRVLAYLFVDGRNYAELAISRHLAEETVSRFGTNGFEQEAAAVRAAARAAGPPPFDSPRAYRDGLTRSPSP